MLLGLAAAALVAALALAPGFGPGLGQAAPPRQDDFEMAIDADIENGNGACDPIDDEVSVDDGATHRVAVCILNPPEPPSAFLVRVVYDGELNMAPELPDVLPALDDNPDANAGETTFSSPDLGDRWDCSGLGIYPPRGDDEYTDDKSDAVLACNADLRNPDATLSDGGPLAVITFQVIGKGDDIIEFDPQTQIGGQVGAIGRCGEVPADIIPCHGAVIHKAGGGEARPRPSATSLSPGATAPSMAGTPASTGAMPGAASTPAEEGDGGFPWAAVGGAVGGVFALVVVATALYAWRRGSRAGA